MGKRFEPENLSTEDQLTLACARTRLGPRHKARITALVDKGIDWSEAIETAWWHGVLPLLTRGLQQSCKNRVPGDTLERLQRRVEEGTRYRLGQTYELIRILDMFESQGIPAIPYKGPVLAYAAYGDLSLRTFGDLDILLPREHVLKAKGLLLDCGYCPEYKLTHSAERAYLQDECEYNFRREKDQMQVELHWALLPRDMSLSTESLHLWDNLQSMAFGGKRVAALSPEKTLLLLCIHGAKHQWQLLKWLCDIAEWLRVHADIDWNLTRRLADECHVRRILFLGVLLAHDLLEAPLSPEVVASARGCATVQVLSRRVYSRLFKKHIYLRGLAKLVDGFFFYFFMRERWQDRLRLFRRLMHLARIELRKVY